MCVFIHFGVCWWWAVKPCHFLLFFVSADEWPSSVCLVFLVFLPSLPPPKRIVWGPTCQPLPWQPIPIRGCLCHQYQTFWFLDCDLSGTKYRAVTKVFSSDRFLLMLLFGQTSMFQTITFLLSDNDEEIQNSDLKQWLDLLIKINLPLKV